MTNERRTKSNNEGTMKMRKDEIAVPAGRGKQQQNLPTTKKAAGLPSSLMDRADKDAGKGTSTDREDNVVPLVRRFQALSPQVNKKGMDYIKGAEPGDIWLKDVALIAGDTGFRFQPCAFWKDIVEWRPRDEGGGYVGRHDAIPDDAEEEEDEKSGRTVFKRNGNELIDTRYHAGFVIFDDGRALPYVIPMKGTDHQVSRSWMTRMNAKRLPSGKTQPPWMSTYIIKTKDRTNPAGTWSTWDIVDADPITTEEEYDRGLGLYEAFSAGTKKADVDSSEDGHGGAM